MLLILEVTICDNKSFFIPFNFSLSGGQKTGENTDRLVEELFPLKG